MLTNPSDILQSTLKGGHTTVETGQAPFLEPNTSYWVSREFHNST